MVGMTDSAALAERYGRRGPGGRPGRSNLVLAVAALAGLVLVAVTIWSFLDQADPDVRSTLRTYDVVSEHEVVATVVVARKDEDVRATCRLHAVALDHSTVGRSQQVVDSGPATQVLEVRIPTERKAVSVIRDGCTSADQKRPR
jgi:hypothetical protein